ncbi:zinc finger, CCHC-type containing protein [Tanacetum coccineum]
MTKKLLSENFDMKDLGEADVILGIKILRKENRLMLTQSYYIENILKRFDSFNFLPVSTPFEVGSKLTYNTARILAQNKYAKVIGSLMYAMTCTRPDIAYAVGRLSRHTSSPGKEHWDAVNRVFKYLKKTMNYGLEYSGDPSVLEDSTMVAEFIALASCCKEAEWLRDLLINIPLWPKPMPPISMHCDSQSTLSRAYNQVYNGKSMHIGLRHRQVNHLINDGVITVSFLRSSNNLADPFIKGLPRKLIESTSQGMGLKPIYGNILDNVHLFECGSEVASYELKRLALKHSEKPRYRTKASLNGSAQSGLNEREEG